MASESQAFNMKSNEAHLHRQTSDDSFNLSTFRFRDLPEELQRYCISFCLASEWHIRASAAMRIDNPDIENRLIYGLRSVPPTPLQYALVDRHMNKSMQASQLKRFTGELYLATVKDYEPGFKTYSQYGFGHDRDSSRLDSFRDLVTTVHTGSYSFVQDFTSLPPTLFQVLTNVQTVIAHSEKHLDVESIYGWGDANSVVTILSETKLIDFMRAVSNVQEPHRSALEALWDKKITTLLEMRISVGHGRTGILFYCIFWIQRDYGATILGKYPMKAWEGSGKLRRSVYAKAC